LIANSVERLIASWAQSSSVVSQGFEGDMAAGAAGVGAVGEATQGGRGLYSAKGKCRAGAVVSDEGLGTALA
jgi:hypothetical protein